MVEGGGYGVYAGNETRRQVLMVKVDRRRLQMIAADGGQDG